MLTTVMYFKLTRLFLCDVLHKKALKIKFTLKLLTSECS